MAPMSVLRCWWSLNSDGLGAVSPHIAMVNIEHGKNERQKVKTFQDDKKKYKERRELILRSWRFRWFAFAVRAMSTLNTTRPVAFGADTGPWASAIQRHPHRNSGHGMDGSVSHAD